MGYRYIAGSGYGGIALSDSEDSLRTFLILRISLTDETCLDSYIPVKDSGLILYELNTNRVQRIITGDAIHEFVMDNSSYSDEL